MVVETERMVCMYVVYVDSCQVVSQWCPTMQQSVTSTYNYVYRIVYCG